MILQLTKQSTDQEIKAYFEEVLRLSRDSEEFPVNLDEVWPLVYADKGKAVRALKTNELFVKDVDYILLAQNGKQVENNGKQDNSWGGNNQITYMISVSCLEFFIARKVRPVFAYQPLGNLTITFSFHLANFAFRRKHKTIELMKTNEWMALIATSFLMFALCLSATV